MNLYLNKYVLKKLFRIAQYTVFPIVHISYLHIIGEW